MSAGVSLPRLLRQLGVALVAEVASLREEIRALRQPPGGGHDP